MAGQEPVDSEEVNGLVSTDSKLMVRALLDKQDVLKDILDKLNDIKEELQGD